MPVSTARETSGRRGHPLDLVEHSIEVRRWSAVRTAPDELVAEVTGRWSDYQLLFVWMEPLGALHASCTFDARVPPDRWPAVHELLALANDKLWVGHFDISAEAGLPSFRHALLLRGGLLSAEQVEDLVDIALSEVDRFYPAFQYVVWGGRRPVDALTASILDTVGHA